MGDVLRDELRRKGKWFKDARIHNIDDSVTKDEAGDGFKYASERYAFFYEQLLALDVEWKEASNVGDQELAKRLDEEFNRTGCTLQYYRDQENRLIMIWGRKADSPVFITGDNGETLLYEPNEAGLPEEEVDLIPITNDQAKEIKMMCQQALNDLKKKPMQDRRVAL